MLVVTAAHGYYSQLISYVERTLAVTAALGHYLQPIRNGLWKHMNAYLCCT